MKGKGLVESSVKRERTDKRKSVAQRKLKWDLVKNENKTILRVAIVYSSISKCAIIHVLVSNFLMDVVV